MRPCQRKQRGHRLTSRILSTFYIPQRESGEDVVARHGVSGPRGRKESMSESINQNVSEERQSVSEGKPSRQRISQRFLLTLAAGLLGLALNAWAVPVFGDLSHGALIFGGIFYLLIAIAYGPTYGLIAALIASSRAVMFWDQPHTIVTCGLEAFIIGWLVQRRKQPLFASLLYWCVISAPFRILIFVVLANDPSTSGWAMVIKEPINGLLNVMLADLLLGLGPIRRLLNATSERAAMRQRPLRAYLFHGFVLIATLPLLFLSIVQGRIYAERQQTQAASPPARDGGGDSPEY